MHDRSLPTLPDRLREARVLLVDDQELNLRVLRRCWSKAGLNNITLTQDPFAVAPLVALHPPTSSSSTSTCRASTAGA